MAWASCWASTSEKPALPLIETERSARKPLSAPRRVWTLGGSALAAWSGGAFWVERGHAASEEPCGSWALRVSPPGNGSAASKSMRQS
jgi:hypothetical protein